MRARTPLPNGLASWFVGKLRERSVPFMADCFDMSSEILRDIIRGRMATDESTQRHATALSSRYDGISIFSATTAYSVPMRTGQKIRIYES
jgi:hypothetical protein